MKMRINTTIFFLYLAISVISFSVFFGAQVFVLLIFWYGLCLIALYLRYKGHRFEVNNWVVFVCVFYPLLEICIKFIMLFDLIPYSYPVLNIIEHALFSGFITIVIAEIFRQSDIVREKLFTPLMVFCVVTTLGFGNELLEFAVRQYQNLHRDIYYYDTIKDMIVNMIASGFVLIILGICQLKIRIRTSKAKHN
jgi:hypothetical protein